MHAPTLHTQASMCGCADVKSSFCRGQGALCAPTRKASLLRILRRSPAISKFSCWDAYRDAPACPIAQPPTGMIRWGPFVSSVLKKVTFMDLMVFLIEHVFKPRILEDYSHGQTSSHTIRDECYLRTFYGGFNASVVPADRSG